MPHRDCATCATRRSGPAWIRTFPFRQLAESDMCVVNVGGHRLCAQYTLSKVDAPKRLKTRPRDTWAYLMREPIDCVVESSMNELMFTGGNSAVHCGYATL